MNKEHKGFYIGVIGGIIVIASIVIVFQLNPKNVECIAVHDLFYTNGNPRPDLNDQTYLKAGYYGERLGTDTDYDFAINFDLTHKPIQWSTCKIQFYVYANKKPSLGGQLRVHLSDYIINDSISLHQQYIYRNWSIDLPNMGFSSSRFKTIDITNLIYDNTTICFYTGGGVLKWDCYILVHSIEADIENEYKPQIIWE